MVVTLPDLLAATPEHAAADQRAHADEARCTCGDIHGPLDWCDYLNDDTRQRVLEGTR